MTDISYEEFTAQLSKVVDLNLSYYSRLQMERRLQNYMNTRLKVSHYSDFIRMVSTDPKQKEDLKGYLTINFSEFFRNPDVYKNFEQIMVEPWSKSNSLNRIRIWSAGCSVGAEIYSIAMLMEQYKLLGKTTLIASDIDRDILEVAQNGFYHDKNMFKHVTPEQMTKYFKPTILNQKEGFQVTMALRSKVQFKQQDLFTSTYDTQLDAVFCRNVVIYFTQEGQVELYHKFHACLKPGGYIVVGSTERIPKELSDKFKEVKPYIYQKI